MNLSAPEFNKKITATISLWILVASLIIGLTIQWVEIRSTTQRSIDNKIEIKAVNDKLLEMEKSESEHIKEVKEDAFGRTSRKVDPLEDKIENLEMENRGLRERILVLETINEYKP